MLQSTQAVLKLRKLSDDELITIASLLATNDPATFIQFAENIEQAQCQPQHVTHPQIVEIYARGYVCIDDAVYSSIKRKYMDTRGNIYKVNAIKFLRTVTGCGLKDAKDIIEKTAQIYTWDAEAKRRNGALWDTADLVAEDVGFLR